MIAFSGVTTTRALEQLLVPHEQVDDLLVGARVVLGEPELLPQRVATDEVGGRILELRDDRPQRLRVRRRLDVEHDVDVDAQLLRNAHGIATAPSVRVVVDRDRGHGGILRPGSAAGANDASRAQQLLARSWRLRRYLTSLSILNIGRYMLMMITPTMQPTPTIIMGSMIEVRAGIDASTSSS